MRLDKFLKVSRIIKRRTVANEACEKGRVNVNGRTAKPSANIEAGDIIEIAFGSGSTKIEVIAIPEHATKESARDMYKIL
jgi:ribosomal 50S subunit-recycling heat shock protein